jgi:transcriptional regulator with XRE-family HTH domain
MQRFGEKLCTLRVRHGISQQKLAAELGASAHSFIYKLETGVKRPNAEHLLKLSRLFGVSIDVLLKDELELD